MPRFCDGTPSVVKSIDKPEICNTRVIVDELAVQRFKNIASVTDTEEEITAVAMEAGELFQPIKHKSLNATWSSVKADDTGLWTTTIVVDLGGFSKESRDALSHLDGMCDLVLWVGLSNCQKRIVGIDKTSDGWDLKIESKLTTEEETMGGQTDASNTATFTAVTFTRPPFTTIDYATLPTPV